MDTSTLLEAELFNLPVDLDTINQKVLPLCGSTNTWAKRLAHHQFPHGSWVSSQQQQAGRARQARVWKSPQGNLYVSIVLRFQKIALVSWIPLIAGLCVRDLLLEEEALEKRPVTIKWPNDLLLEGRKIGGILCEGGCDVGSPWVVCGIGVNWSQAPEGVPGATTLGFCEANLDSFRQRLIQRLVQSIDFYDQEDSKDELFKKFWQSSHYSRGDCLSWSLPNSVANPKMFQKGTLQGISSHGALMVENEQGKLLELYGEEIHLSRDLA